MHVSILKACAHFFLLVSHCFRPSSPSISQTSFPTISHSPLGHSPTLCSVLPPASPHSSPPTLSFGNWFLLRTMSSPLRILSRHFVPRFPAIQLYTSSRTSSLANLRLIFSPLDLYISVTMEQP